MQCAGNFGRQRCAYRYREDDEQCRRRVTLTISFTRPTASERSRVYAPASVHEYTIPSGARSYALWDALKPVDAFNVTAAAIGTSLSASAYNTAAPPAGEPEQPDALTAFQTTVFLERANHCRQLFRRTHHYRLEH